MSRSDYDTPPCTEPVGEGQPPRTVDQRAMPIEARRQMRDHEVVESCEMFMMMLRNLAAPLRPSRAARRRDGCRGGNCVIVYVCIVCGATRAMRATRARGAST